MKGIFFTLTSAVTILTSTILSAETPALLTLTSYWNQGKADYQSLATAEGQKAIQEVFHYKAVRPEGKVFAAQQPDTVPLKVYGLWTEEKTDNAVAASKQSQEDFAAKGYKDVEVQGYVYAKQHPGTVPLKLFYNEKTLDYFAAASSESEKVALRDGYKFVRVEGFVFPAGQ